MQLVKGRRAAGGCLVAWESGGCCEYFLHPCGGPGHPSDPALSTSASFVKAMVLKASTTHQSSSDFKVIHQHIKYLTAISDNFHEIYALSRIR